VFGSAERWLGIDHPIVVKQGTEERCEDLRVSQRKTFAVKSQLAVLRRASQSGHEFPTEHPTEHLDR
jgi:hypothetical protein